MKNRLKKITKTFGNGLKRFEYYVDNKEEVFVYYIEFNYQGNIVEIVKLIDSEKNLNIRYRLSGVIATVETEKNEEDHGVEINFHYEK